MKFSDILKLILNKKSGIIVFLLFVFSCSTDKETLVPIVDIQGSPIEVSEDFTGIFCEAAHGDTLIFLSYAPEFVSEAAQFRNDSLIHLEYLNHRGQGPDDVTSAAVFKSCKGFSVLAKTSGGIKIKEIERFDATADWNTISIDSFVSPFYWENCAIVEVNEDSIILVGTRYGHELSILSIIDLKNKELSGLDYWPDDGYSGPMFPKRNVYSNNARLFSNGSGKYVYKTGVNRNAFIFSLNGSHVNVEKRLYGRPIKYEAADDGLNFKYQPEIEGLYLYATNRAIYCLLIEQTEDGAPADSFNNSNSGNRIDVYDWEGNLHQRLSLSHPVASFIVDDDDTFLLTQSLNVNEETGQHDFVKYRLPNRL